MSDFLQNPNFQPNDEFKNLIDSLFPGEERKNKEVHQHTFQLNLPEPDPLDEAEENMALKIIRDELESFRIAYLEFQDKVTDMGIYTYLYPGIQVFADECEDFDDLIEDNFDSQDLSHIGEQEREEARKVRQRIISSVWKQYKQGK